MCQGKKALKTKEVFGEGKGICGGQCALREGVSKKTGGPH